MSRKFEVEVNLLLTLKVEDEVIDRVDDEWRSQLYNLRSPEQIAEHLAFNIVVNQDSLSWLDGWADLPDEMMNYSIDREFVEVRAREER